MRRKHKVPKPWHVVEYGECPCCDMWSIGVQRNGKIVRHSIGFGYVEKVGPGTRYPMFRTTICKGSGYQYRPKVKREVGKLASRLALNQKSEGSNPSFPATNQENAWLIRL